DMHVWVLPGLRIFTQGFVRGECPGRTPKAIAAITAAPYDATIVKVQRGRRTDQRQTAIGPFRDSEVPQIHAGGVGLYKPAPRRRGPMAQRVRFIEGEGGDVCAYNAGYIHKRLPFSQTT